MQLFAIFRALLKEERKAFINEMLGEEVVGEMVKDMKEDSKDEDGQDWMI